MDLTWQCGLRKGLWLYANKYGGLLMSFLHFPAYSYSGNNGYRELVLVWGVFREGEQGYDDGISSPAMLESSSSFVESTEQDEGPVDSTTSVNTNKVVQSDHLNYVYGDVIVRCSQA